MYQLLHLFFVLLLRQPHNNCQMIDFDMVLQEKQIFNLIFAIENDFVQKKYLPVKFCGEFDACSIDCNDRCIGGG